MPLVVVENVLELLDTGAGDKRSGCSRYPETDDWNLWCFNGRFIERWHRKLRRRPHASGGEEIATFASIVRDAVVCVGCEANAVWIRKIFLTAPVRGNAKHHNTSRMNLSNSLLCSSYMHKDNNDKKNDVMRGQLAYCSSSSPAAVPMHGREEVPGSSTRKMDGRC